MKILRKLRRRKIKLSFIFLLLLVFIFNTYAWMSTDKTTETGGLTANVSTWGVEFIINGEEIKTDEYTFEIDEFHPGIDSIEKKINVYNIGEAGTNLKYEIIDIYLYGESILKKQIDAETAIPETVGEEGTNAEGYTTIEAFGNDEATIFDENNTNYSFSLRYPTPFSITCTYDKTQLAARNTNSYADGTTPAETPGASTTACMTINLSWYNDENNNEEDTKLGNLAYDFEQTNGDEPALKIVTRITAKRIM